MNVTSIPGILTDETLFDTCAREAASHVMKQPPYISKPIAAYGAFIAQGVPAGRERLVNFMRAMCQAKVNPWTDQLKDPLYADDLDRLENAIAHKCYHAYIAQAADCAER